MRELSELYAKTTGLTVDIDKLIEAAESQEEKAKLFSKLSWSIQRGKHVDNVEGYLTKDYVILVKELAEELNINIADDADGDGDVDSTDERINKELEKVEEFFSEIDIEVGDSSTD